MLSEVPIVNIMPDPEQPRKQFDEEDLNELANSIREHGLIQPIAVEAIENGLYLIQDGERRWRASQIAGLKQVPIVVHPATNGNGLERFMRSMVANLQRVDLSPMEEARGYQQLRDLGLSNNKIAIKLGVNIARVSRFLKLLEFDEQIQDLIQSGELSSDGRLTDALMNIPGNDLQIQMARKLVEKKTTVIGGIRACKEFVRHLNEQQEFSSGIPALDIAEKRKGKVDRPKWDAIAQIGKLPTWILLEIVVRDTCEACDVRDMASQVVCGSCPLVELLKKLIGVVEK